MKHTDFIHTYQKSYPVRNFVCNHTHTVAPANETPISIHIILTKSIELNKNVM